jgi:hypothetical protein
MSRHLAVSQVDGVVFGYDKRFLTKQEKAPAKSRLGIYYLRRYVFWFS